MLQSLLKLLFLFILGACLGSFLNVLIYRIPLILENKFKARVSNLSICTPRSFCPKCGKKISWHNLIPIFSWIILKGKCSECRAPIALSYLLVELISGFIMVGSFYYYNGSCWGLLVVIASYILLALSLIDKKTMLLPDCLTLPLMWLGIIAAYYGYSSLTLHESCFGVIFGYGFLFIINNIFYLYKKQNGIGGGDLKLVAALGAWIGSYSLILVMLFASIFAIIIRLITCNIKAYKSSQKSFAFGPYLASFGWLFLLFGNDITSWYYLYFF